MAGSHPLLVMLCVAMAAPAYGAQVEKAARPPQAAAPQPADSAPAFPFRYAGRLERPGLPTMLALTRGTDTYVIAAGDMIGTSYRLETISADHMTVTYLPLKQKQTIAYSSIRPDKSPATTVTAPAVVPAPAAPSRTPLGTQSPTCC
jgi:hypothetical protein